jgi:hypothetical protein
LYAAEVPEKAAACAATNLAKCTAEAANGDTACKAAAGDCAYATAVTKVTEACATMATMAAADVLCSCPYVSGAQNIGKEVTATKDGKTTVSCECPSWTSLGLAGDSAVQLSVTLAGVTASAIRKSNAMQQALVLNLARTAQVSPESVEVNLYNASGFFFGNISLSVDELSKIKVDGRHRRRLAADDAVVEVRVWNMTAGHASSAGAALAAFAADASSTGMAATLSAGGLPTSGATVSSSPLAFTGATPPTTVQVFRCSYGGGVTRYMTMDVSPSIITAEFLKFPKVGAVVVSGKPGVPHWNVTFLEVVVPQPLSCGSPAGVSKTIEKAIATPKYGIGARATQLRNSTTSLGGTWAISFKGLQTPALAFDATAATVQAALEALKTPGAVHVAPAGTVTVGLQSAVLTDAARAGQSFTVRFLPLTALGGAQPLLVPSATGLTGSQASVVVERIAGGASPEAQLVLVKDVGGTATGTFTLSGVNGLGSMTGAVSWGPTLPIPVAAKPVELMAALGAAGADVANVTAATKATYAAAWLVVFGHGDVPELVADAALVSTGAVAVEMVTNGSTARIGGSFKLSFGVSCVETAETVLAKTLHCLSWRQTSQCDPEGRREPAKDLPCTALVPSTASGFCECGSEPPISGPGVPPRWANPGGRKAMRVRCDHVLFTCADVCARVPVNRPYTSMKPWNASILPSDPDQGGYRFTANTPSRLIHQPYTEIMTWNADELGVHRIHGDEAGQWPRFGDYRKESKERPTVPNLGTERAQKCTPVTTAPLPHNASAEMVRAALEGLSSTRGAVRVSRGEQTERNGQEWRVTFMDMVGDLPPIHVDSTHLNGTAAEVRVVEVRAGTTVSSGRVAVEVTTNDQDYSASGITFEYQPTVRVVGLYPNHGPVYGATEVQVWGENFVNSTGLFCHFGHGGPNGRGQDGDGVTSSVPASAFVNTTLIKCITPPRLVEGAVRVQVSLNGAAGASNRSGHGPWFTYDPPVEVHSFEPPSAPVNGNYSVRVVGRHFLPNEEVKCKFGHMVVQAIWLNDAELVCRTPAHVPGAYPLEITSNDQDYTTFRRPFFFYPRLRMSRMEPVAGPARAAGTAVTIYGAGWVNTTLLTCRFGALHVPATFISSTRLTCEAPPLRFDSTLKAGNAHQSHVNDHGPGAPPAPNTGSPMTWMPLTAHRNRVPDPWHGSVRLFPLAHYHPLFLSKLVAVEVSANGQDFTDSGTTFLYQADARVLKIQPRTGHGTGLTPLFLQGEYFVNSTFLACRFGSLRARARFISPNLILCFTPPRAALLPAHGLKRHDRRGRPESAVGPGTGITGPGGTVEAGSVYVEVTNNGVDFTTDHRIFTYLPPCPTGSYCPEKDLTATYVCPRGTYCPGMGNANFTLCPQGTYQPNRGASGCLRCPMGYICPDEGMPVPRICPAGYVCDVTGIERAEQPCPEGHFCLEGTATTATTCGHKTPSSKLFPSLTQAEFPTTQRMGRKRRGNRMVLGARNAGCWSNGTDDFGLQVSPYPARFWMERHLLPLSSTSPFVPRRGRYCLDDACIRLADAEDLSVADYAFDFSSSAFALRRPIPCPAGTYCHAGTAGAGGDMKNFTSPQPCFEAMYCPEGSSNPRGIGLCPKGFHCPFGTKVLCPVGSYCPRDGHHEPFSCPPGKYNGQLGMGECSKCPLGTICPGHGRVDPAICPGGYVCSRHALDSPNIRCPKGFYCPNGTVTSDPFRNDTTLRPLPCAPGTYCMGGVSSSSIRRGDFRFAQPCTEGFYCELASVSPMGAGLCPKGFLCPEGTAVPKPTPVGFFAEMEGTVEPAACLPGFYAPTIETVKCYPCPPGTQCENDGSDAATICPPGTFRATLGTAAEGLGHGVICAGCPQGRWSKNWELREEPECQLCPPGVVCPIDGMTRPCSRADLPTTYEPTRSCAEGICESQFECEKKTDHFYGVLVSPVDTNAKGPIFKRVQAGFEHIIEWHPTRLDKQFEGKFWDRGGVAGGRFTWSPTGTKIRLKPLCYYNAQPFGTSVYLRMQDYHGPLFNIQAGGRFHQGYGDLKYEGFFGRGSLYIDLPVAKVYDPARNCTPGFWFYNNTVLADEWKIGTCEVDVFCNNPGVPQAQPCSEGYVCDEGTSAITATETHCPEGFVCDFGTTPDLSLEARNGKFKMLCPEGYQCLSATGKGQMFRSICEPEFFCPTGTSTSRQGRMSNDALVRNFPRQQVNPYFPEKFKAKLFCGDYKVAGSCEWRPRPTSAHDELCYNGINSTLIESFEYKYSNDSVARQYLPQWGNLAGELNLATKANLQCARDHKWRLVNDAIARLECDCTAQVHRVLKIFHLWKCTKAWRTEPPWPSSKPNAEWPPWRYGGDEALSPHVPPAEDVRKQCLWWSYRLVPANADPATRSSGWVKGQMENQSYVKYNVSAGITVRTTWNDFYPAPEGYNAAQASSPSPAPSPGADGGDGMGMGLPDAPSPSPTPADYGEKRYPYVAPRPEAEVVWGLDPGQTPKSHFNDYDEFRTYVVGEYISQAMEKRAGTRTRFDPLTLDLHYAIELIETLGDRVADIIGVNEPPMPRLWEDGTLRDSMIWEDRAGQFPGNEYGQPLRLDACLCERLLWCPNGTTSALGSKSIFDCTKKAATDVLRRVVPISPDSIGFREGRLVGNEDRVPLSGYRGQGIGHMNLLTHEVATFTLNLTGISRNLTYNEHYQIGVYVDCDPCPVRYQCSPGADPPTCLTPSLEVQGLLGYMCEDCCKCKRKKLPAFFEDKTDGLPSSVQAQVNMLGKPWRDPEVMARNYKTKACLPGDLSCQRKYKRCRINSKWTKERGDVPGNTALPNELARALDIKSYKDRPAGSFQMASGDVDCYSMRFKGYPDTKHQVVQFTLQALRNVKVTVVIELLHGLYVGEFDQIFRGVGEFNIFTPNRNDYVPECKSNYTKCKRKVFLAIIMKEDFGTKLAAPLNLPANDASEFEQDLLINRPADFRIGDRTLDDRWKTGFIVDDEEIGAANDTNATLAPAPATADEAANLLLGGGRRLRHMGRRLLHAVGVGRLLLGDDNETSTNGSSPSPVSVAPGSPSPAAAVPDSPSPVSVAPGSPSPAATVPPPPSPAAAVPGSPSPAGGTGTSASGDASGDTSGGASGDAASNATTGTGTAAAAAAVAVPEEVGVCGEGAAYNYSCHTVMPFVVRDSLDAVGTDVQFWDKADGGRGADFFGLPYFPFFSNCRGYDSHMSIAKVLETHPDCDNKLTLNESAFVAQWPWEGFAPVADKCYQGNVNAEKESRATYNQRFDSEIRTETFKSDAWQDVYEKPQYSDQFRFGTKMSCAYEENIYVPFSTARWFEQKSGATLFYITANAMGPEDFEAVADDEETEEDDETERWGATKTIKSFLGSDEYLAVEVIDDFGSSKSPPMVPRTVRLYVGYYQKSLEEKRLIEVTVGYDDKCTTTEASRQLADAAKQDVYPCEKEKYDYTLELEYYPMNWFELLNAFAFDVPVYIAFFFLVGLATIGECLVMWVVMRLITRLKHPPPLRFKALLKITVIAPAHGVFLATIPMIFGCLFIHIWWNLLKSDDVLNRPSILCFEDQAGDFLDGAQLDVERIENYRTGRIGTSFICMGMYVVLVGCKMFVPNNTDAQGDDDLRQDDNAIDAEAIDDDDEDAVVVPSAFWTPLEWKRAHLIFACFTVGTCLLWIWEFSYSYTFENYVYTFIIIFKLVQMLVDMVLASFMRENLLISPLLVVIEVTEMLVTMGASSFIDFVTSYFIELTIMIFERILLDPGMKHIAKLWPKWRMMLKRRFAKKRHMTREQRAREEAEWKRINEEIALESEGVEPLLDSYSVYANETLALICTPFVIVFLLCFTEETQMAALYGIKVKELGFYVLFGFTMIPFSLVADMFLLSSQELFHGWKLYDYVSYQKYRFSVREHRWQMTAFDTLDESIAEPLQSIDMMCFSSQFYFMSCVLAYGILFMMFGATIQLRAQYHLFGDIAFPIIMLNVFTVCALIQKACIKMSDVLGIWVRKNLSGTVDDEIAAKLAIGEGRQEDLEAERLELQAMNSERFRHRFLERSRPWILQHLVELLTPRTLKAPGLDGRPNIEYIRDVYADLMNMEVGRRRPGDRSDISSDEDDDEMERRRREWSKKPLSRTSAAVLRWWLEQARMRRTLTKLVKGTIDRNCLDRCELCGRTQASGASMRCDLAMVDDKGQRVADSHGIDKLMRSYMEAFPDRDFDENLWQAHFRKFATFITRCSVCIDLVEQAAAKKHKRHPGPQRGARAGDISSDEESSDDDIVFDPMVVSRSSIEGRMMSKWLQAARRRLGGMFPREQARGEMEDYAKRMRDKKAAKAKKRARNAAGGGSDDDDEPRFAVRPYINAASKAIAVLWLRKARGKRVEAHRDKGLKLRTDVVETLGQMPEEDDWYFGSEMRLQGESLVEEGQGLDAQRRQLEAEASVSVGEIEQRLEEFVREKQDMIAAEKEAVMEKAKAGRSKAVEAAESRMQELKLERMRREAGFKAEEDKLNGDAKTAAIDRHRAELGSLDAAIRSEQQRQLNIVESKAGVVEDELTQKQAKREFAIADRKEAAAKKIAALREDVDIQMKHREVGWQQRSMGWIVKGQGKISAKKAADAETAGQANKKKARRKQL